MKLKIYNALSGFSSTFIIKFTFLLLKLFISLFICELKFLIKMMKLFINLDAKTHTTNFCEKVLLSSSQSHIVEHRQPLLLNGKYDFLDSTVFTSGFCLNFFWLTSLSMHIYSAFLFILLV